MPENIVFSGTMPTHVTRATLPKPFTPPFLAAAYEYTPAPLVVPSIPIGVEKRRALTAADRELMSPEQIRAYNDALQGAGGPLPPTVPRGGMTSAQRAEIDTIDEANRAYKWERETQPGMILPGSTTVAIPMGWSWPGWRVPTNAQEADEKAAYDAGHAQTVAALPDANPDEIKSLIDQLIAALKSSEYVNTQKAQMQGILDALQSWQIARGLNPPKTAAQGLQEIATPAPSFPAGKLWHVMPWDDKTVLASEGQKIKQFLMALIKRYAGNSVLAQLLPSQIFMLRDYAQNVWNAHQQGDFMRAGDLRDDAIANSDPALADALREIEQWAEQAEPKTVPGKGFKGRPTRR
jgi:hypothetical protein